MSHNAIQALPPNIGHLSHLVRLNVSYNQLSVLPAEIGSIDGETASLTSLTKKFHRRDTDLLLCTNINKNWLISCFSVLVLHDDVVFEFFFLFFPQVCITLMPPTMSL